MCVDVSVSANVYVYLSSTPNSMAEKGEFMKRVSYVCTYMYVTYTRHGVRWKKKEVCVRERNPNCVTSKPNRLSYEVGMPSFEMRD